MVFVIEGLLNASDIFPFIFFGDIGKPAIEGCITDTRAIIDIKGFEHIAYFYGTPDHGANPSGARAVSTGY